VGILKRWKLLGLRNDPNLRKVVIIVAVLNLASYFGVQFAVALAIDSVSPFADSVDFLEDASVNFLIAIALGWSATTGLVWACPSPASCTETAWVGPSCVRERLYRPLYRGEIVWNKTKKLHRGRTKQQRQRPESEWISLPVPELWDKVHGRLKDAHDRFARGTITGHLFGRSSRQDRDSTYLLSGVGRCTLCEGPLIALTRDHGKKRARFNGCSYHHNVARRCVRMRSSSSKRSSIKRC
jgi:hypothetical protein